MWKRMVRRLGWKMEMFDVRFDQPVYNRTLFIVELFSAYSSHPENLYCCKRKNGDIMNVM